MKSVLKKLADHNLRASQTMQGEVAAMRCGWEYIIDVDAADGFQIWIDGEHSFITLCGDSVKELHAELEAALEDYAILPVGENPNDT